MAHTSEPAGPALEAGPRDDAAGGTDGSSTLNPTPADPHAAERRANEAFIRADATPEHRERIGRYYDRWQVIGAEHFGGGLPEVHFGIAPTAPRRFCEYRPTTAYGGRASVVVAERVAFATDRRVVRTPYPAAGYVRFEDDLLLGAAVKVFVSVVRGSDEGGDGGYGPLYAAEATRIGASLGLPPVAARRRGRRGAGLPVAAFWPWAFRPDGYYLGDVRLNHLRVDGLRAAAPPAHAAAVPGVFEYFLYLLTTGRADRLTEILGRAVDAEWEARDPVGAAAERGPTPLPHVDPAVRHWNGGCVRAIAAGIRARRAFDGLPILADALQDAGCDDATILDHCRAACRHTARCWVLDLLAPPDEPAE